MVRKNLALLFLLAVISFNLSADSHYRDKLTAQAAELAKKYAMADDAEKSAVMSDFDQLARENPENVNVIRIYTSLLSSQREYKKALAYLEPVNKEKNNSSLLLQECMLKDRLERTDLACYQHVIAMTEHDGVQNMDYLMALYFSGNEKFQTVKKEMEEHNQALRAYFSFFEQDKRSALLTLYP